MLSEKAKTALTKCFATRGRNRGQLLARCPDSRTLAAAAWQGAMMAANPYKVSICAMIFMAAEQKEICREVTAHFDAMPKDHRIMADRDREQLEWWGAW